MRDIPRNSMLGLVLLADTDLFELSFTRDDGVRYVAKLEETTALLLARSLLQGVGALEHRRKAQLEREAN